jgi:hypothetical protein
MKIHLLSKILFACLLLCNFMATAQQPEILLWPNGAPGSEGKAGVEKVRVVEGDHVISNIHNFSVIMALLLLYLNTVSRAIQTVLIR